MSAWQTLPRVSWSSPPLLSFRASRATLEGALGVPQIANADSNGLGPFDAWAIRFECGLEVWVWLFQLRSDGSTIDDPHELANAEVHANEPREKHILFHLTVPVTDLGHWDPSPVVPEPLDWCLVRQDDNGARFEIARYPSRCEAMAHTATFEARGHKQTYWVERVAPHASE